MFQEVMQDPGLALFYGDDDLTFIRKLRNPKVILTVVKQVRHGMHPRPPGSTIKCIFAGCHSLPAHHTSALFREAESAPPFHTSVLLL